MSRWIVGNQRRVSVRVTNYTFEHNQVPNEGPSARDVHFSIENKPTNSPVSAAGQVVNDGEDGVRHADARGPVGMVQPDRVSHDGQIDQHDDGVEHVHHQIYGVDAVDFWNWRGTHRKCNK